MLEPKIMKYVPKNKVEAIKDAFIDDDGMWIRLNYGWNADRTDICARTIHEDTIKDLRYQIAGITKKDQEWIDYHKGYYC